MNIIFGKHHAEQIGSKYTVLELDTFVFKNTGLTETAYCVVETIPIVEMNQVLNLQKLHNTMMVEYKKRNWNFCRQALEHLNGKWNGTVDSFYIDINRRINELEKTDLSEDWNGFIEK
jgi:hypothetical protein